MNPSNLISTTLTAQWSLASYVKTFSYTGAAQTWTVPYTGKYKVELWGAQGGSSGTFGTAGRCNADGSYGGYVSGQTSATASTNLYVYIGQHVTEEETGSFNGSTSSTSCGAAGGGATDIRTTNGAWNNAASLRSRIIVAGGGGNVSDKYNETNSGPACKSSNYGGGLNGGSCKATSVSSTATQTAAAKCVVSGSTNACGSYTPGTMDGAFGAGANAGAGGGGGWYGGSGGGYQKGGGTGGSSYISGHTGSVAVTSTSSSTPKSGCTTGTTNNACSISPYGYTFTDTVMIDGGGYKWTNTKGSKTNMPTTSGSGTEVGHSGNGYAKITWLGN
ncbi:hypothetical protein J6W91_02105 [Candidatus Saccharibacteria bacterium]|nr:hypothetical protein [Candidatus Saccharibacteria bacterium]